MQSVLIVGATSAIAQEVARRFAHEGASLYLAARRAERLDTLAADLKLRGAQRVGVMAIDMNDLSAHASLWRAATQFLGTVDAVLIAHGSLPDQRQCEADVALAMREFSTNATSVIAFLTLIANDFVKAGRGCIAVISSVAGDRGRGSNYLYGAAKGAVSIFLSGLRNRLTRAGVRVVTIKPGFVDTPMTAHLPKNALFAKPGAVARGIHRAMAGGGDIVYLPGFWRWIMFIIRVVPERIFKRLSL